MKLISYSNAMTFFCEKNHGDHVCICFFLKISTKRPFFLVRGGNVELNSVPRVCVFT